MISGLNGEYTFIIYSIQGAPKAVGPYVVGFYCSNFLGHPVDLSLVLQYKGLSLIYSILSETADARYNHVIVGFYNYVLLQMYE